MVPDPRYTVLGLEYFCFDSDSMWNAPDADLIAMGTRELAKLGLCEEAKVVDGTVVASAPRIRSTTATIAARST